MQYRRFHFDQVNGDLQFKRDGKRSIIIFILLRQWYNTENFHGDYLYRKDHQSNAKNTFSEIKLYSQYTHTILK